MPKKWKKLWGWDWIKTQLLKQKHLLHQKNHLVKKLLKPTGFYLLWKPTYMSTFMPFTFSSDSDRSSPSEVFLEKDVVKICSKFTGECPCWFASSIKLLCTTAFQHGYSPVNLLHVFRIPSPKNSSGELLLVVSSLYRQVDTMWKCPYLEFFGLYFPAFILNMLTRY